MTLHNVPVESAVHGHRAFYIDFVTHLEQPQVGAVKGFFHGSDSVAVALHRHHSEAHAVMRNTLVYLQLVGKGARKREMHIVLVVDDGRDLGH